MYQLNKPPLTSCNFFLASGESAVDRPHVHISNLSSSVPTIDLLASAQHFSVGSSDSCFSTASLANHTRGEVGTCLVYLPAIRSTLSGLPKVECISSLMCTDNNDGDGFVRWIRQVRDAIR